MSFYRQGLLIGAEDTSRPKKDDGVITFIILAVITIVIFGLSPGARHFYKHGQLPPG